MTACGEAACKFWTGGSCDCEQAYLAEADQGGVDD